MNFTVRLFDALVDVDPASRVAVINFNDDAEDVTGGYLDGTKLDDLKTAVYAIDYAGSPRQNPDGSLGYQSKTNTCKAFQTVKDMPGRDSDHQHVILLLTDGKISGGDPGPCESKTTVLADEFKNDDTLVFSILVTSGINFYPTYVEDFVAPQIRGIVSKPNFFQMVSQYADVVATDFIRSVAEDLACQN